jgi:hypothetical protein
LRVVESRQKQGTFRHIEVAQTVDSLKGKLKTIKEKVWLRKSLAGLQFGISAVVIIAAVVVSQQVTYFFNHDMGYDKEYVVYQKGIGRISTRYHPAIS